MFLFTKHKQDEFIFPGLLKGEKFKFMFRKHSVIFLFILFRFISQIGVLGILVYILLHSFPEIKHTWESHFIGIIICIFWTYFVFSFVVKTLNYFNRITVVTNFRIIDQTRTLITTINFDVFDLREIQMIDTKAPNIYHTLLQMGNLQIILKGTDSQKIIHNISYPYNKLKLINELKEEAFNAPFPINHTDYKNPPPPDSGFINPQTTPPTTNITIHSSILDRERQNFINSSKSTILKLL